MYSTFIQFWHKNYTPKSLTSLKKLVIIYLQTKNMSYVVKIHVLLSLYSDDTITTNKISITP